MSENHVFEVFREHRNVKFSKNAKYYFDKDTLIQPDWMEIESRGD